MYTDYDNLLHRGIGWPTSRATVAPKTLEVLASWRGDKDDDIDVVEDILREIIVISDNEEDDEDPKVVTPQNMGGVASGPRSQPSLASSPRITREGLGDKGRSDRIGTRRQIWLDARERRKEPVSLPQARDDHSYYMPRSGRDAPADVDQKSYEQRLRGLEDRAEERIPSIRKAHKMDPQSSSSQINYEQVRFTLALSRPAVFLETGSMVL